jgi:hypothetical protein
VGHYFLSNLRRKADRLVKWHTTRAKWNNHLRGSSSDILHCCMNNCCYSGRVCTVSYVAGCDLLGKHCPIWTSDCRSDWWPQHMDNATSSQPLGSDPTSHHLIQPSPLVSAGVCFTLSKTIPKEYKHTFRFLNPKRNKLYPYISQY